MTIKSKTVGIWNENSYFLEIDGEALLIDPGDNFEDLDSYFETWRYNVLGIINTHGHFDHIGAVKQFKDKYTIPFYIHSEDKRLVSQGNMYRKFAGGSYTVATPKIDQFLDNMGSLNLGDKKIKIHHTPGHTNGSVCFEIDNVVISGDVLFKNSLGRTDLPGGNATVLKTSIEYVLSHFRNYTIYPGHGEAFVLDSSSAAAFKTYLD